MNERVYQGWHKVTDPNYVIMAAMYCPVSDSAGFLAVKYWGEGIDVCYEDVPLKKYENLISVPYALNYFTKQIKQKHNLAGQPPISEPYKPEGDGPARKKKRQLRERLEAVKEAVSIEYDMFGQVMSGSPAKSGKSSRS